MFVMGFSYVLLSGIHSNLNAETTEVIEIKKLHDSDKYAVHISLIDCFGN